MFRLNLKEEDIIMKIAVMKKVSNKDVAINFISNLVTRAGGDVAYKINLIVTKDSLYLEHVGHASLGYAEETREVDHIPFKDLKEFSVTTKGENEEVKILTSNKEFNLFKDNSKGDNLASTMGKVVEDLK
ncbi:hypothetical protein [Clostridium perfringens]|mgnify:FL=1|uniref:YokE-like PH domain-containing protein n=2 Tax=Clostridium perfringens TaxID=1502 RepID=A0A2X2VED0_CLOPF|nr:hypothetical protein [Clostridium perfringens]EJT5917901.1 hypothetical protein [Clostridium perfringens]EJT5926246.1 hypothetical protein [Clostridium perfringens]EJT5940367.1 hypothetical protein [Clostridium perfringens]EJT6136610.1 hypothetical protein [Clostridium perfringens]EJT6151785.1 hypothetical protein [Clostridium perfringens]